MGPAPSLGSKDSLPVLFSLPCHFLVALLAQSNCPLVASASMSFYELLTLWIRRSHT